MLGEDASLLPGAGKSSNLFGADDAKKKRDALSVTSILIQVTQAVLIIFYGVFSRAGGEITTDSSKDFNVGYSMFSGVLIMMIVGFGYLMTFISNYELGSVAFCILITVIAFQFSMFTEAFFTKIYDASWSYITLDIYDMINSLYAVAAVLISFGAVIGKTTPSQVLIMTLLELVFYSFNNRIFQVGILDLADCGGTIVIHMFGAYYGLAVSYMLGLPKAVVKETYTADIFSFIGTAFLWAYWPSFVGGFLEPGSYEQQRAITSTVLALVGSTTAAFSASILYAHDGRFSPAHIQNATLAGGVAIGSIANLTLDPFTPVLLGFIAGHVSTFGFAYFQSVVESSLEVHDSAGINNLHGMPSLIGGLASVVVAAYKTTGGRTSDSAVYGSDAEYQSLWQLMGVLITLFIAIVSGLLTGLILRNVETGVSFSKFSDKVWWETHNQAKLDD